MKKITLLALLALSSGANAQDLPLLGPISHQSLASYQKGVWSGGSSEYQPNLQQIDALSRINSKHLSVKVYLGTWCGDSKREVPKFMKIASQLGWDESQVSIVGLSDLDSLYKQSPTHEEKGMSIYRVPTFIVYSRNKEIGRIIEKPVTSLERDLVSILVSKDYEPNYPVYDQVSTLLREGILSDPNVNLVGVAHKLKPVVSTASDLNALGYVWLGQRLPKEALAIFTINTILFPQSSNCWDSLGEAYAKTGNKLMAISMYTKALKLDPNNSSSLQALKVLQAE